MNKTSEKEKQQLLKGRLVSIDALRGFDMFWIIGGGAVFSGLHKVFDNPITAFTADQLEHAEWQGFHFEDLIFPLFLFVVGAVLPFSVLRRIEQGQSRASVYLHILKRTAILILLGLILNGLCAGRVSFSASDSAISLPHCS